MMPSMVNPSLFQILCLQFVMQTLMENSDNISSEETTFPGAI